MHQTPRQVPAVRKLTAADRLSRSKIRWRRTSIVPSSRVLRRHHCDTTVSRPGL